MRTLFLLTALLSPLTVPLPAQPILGPYTAAGNFSADLTGTPDTRPGTWGVADSVVNKLTFYPPPGYAVRILELHGDYVLWPTTMGNGPAVVATGLCMGGLAAIRSTAQAGSVRADWMADSTFMYVQAASCGGAAARVPFDLDLSKVKNAILESDGVLEFVQAVWLSDTGLMSHMEVTFSSIVYQFEPVLVESQPAVQALQSKIPRQR